MVISEEAGHKHDMEPTSLQRLCSIQDTLVLVSQYTGLSLAAPQKLQVAKRCAQI